MILTSQRNYIYVFGILKKKKNTSLKNILQYDFLKVKQNKITFWTDFAIKHLYCQPSLKYMIMNIHTSKNIQDHYILGLSNLDVFLH